MAPSLSGIASAAACAIGRSLLSPNETSSHTFNGDPCGVHVVSESSRSFDFRRTARDLTSCPARGLGETKSLCAVVHRCTEMERRLNQAEVTAIENRSRIAAHLNEESLRRASIYRSSHRNGEQFDTQSFRSDRHFSRTPDASRAAASLKRRLSLEGAQPSAERNGISGGEPSSGSTAVLRVLQQCQQLEEDLAARKWDQRTPSSSVEEDMSNARASRSELSWSRGRNEFRESGKWGVHENDDNAAGSAMSWRSQSEQPSSVRQSQAGSREHSLARADWSEEELEEDNQGAVSGTQRQALSDRESLRTSESEDKDHRKQSWLDDCGAETQATEALMFEERGYNRPVEAQSQGPENAGLIEARERGSERGSDTEKDRRKLSWLEAETICEAGGADLGPDNPLGKQRSQRSREQLSQSFARTGHISDGEMSCTQSEGHSGAEEQERGLEALCTAGEKKNGAKHWSKGSVATVDKYLDSPTFESCHSGVRARHSELADSMRPESDLSLKRFSSDRDAKKEGALVAARRHRLTGGPLEAGTDAQNSRRGSQMGPSTDQQRQAGSNPDIEGANEHFQNGRAAGTSAARASFAEESLQQTNVLAGHYNEQTAEKQIFSEGESGERATSELEQKVDRLTSAEGEPLWTPSGFSGTGEAEPSKRSSRDASALPSYSSSKLEVREQSRRGSLSREEQVQKRGARSSAGGSTIGNILQEEQALRSGNANAIGGADSRRSSERVCVPGPEERVAVRSELTGALDGSRSERATGARSGQRDCNRGTSRSANRPASANEPSWEQTGNGTESQADSRERNGTLERLGSAVADFLKTQGSESVDLNGGLDNLGLAVAELLRSKMYSGTEVAAQNGSVQGNQSLNGTSDRRTSSAVARRSGENGTERGFDSAGAPLMERNSTGTEALPRSRRDAESTMRSRSDNGTVLGKRNGSGQSLHQERTARGEATDDKIVAGPALLQGAEAKRTSDTGGRHPRADSALTESRRSEMTRRDSEQRTSGDDRPQADERTLWKSSSQRGSKLLQASCEADNRRLFGDRTATSKQAVPDDPPTGTPASFRSVSERESLASHIQKQRRTSVGQVPVRVVASFAEKEARTGSHSRAAGVPSIVTSRGHVARTRVGHVSLEGEASDEDRHSIAHSDVQAKESYRSTPAEKGGHVPVKAGRIGAAQATGRRNGVSERGDSQAEIPLPERRVSSFQRREKARSDSAPNGGSKSGKARAFQEGSENDTWAEKRVTDRLSTRAHSQTSGRADCCKIPFDDYHQHEMRTDSRTSFGRRDEAWRCKTGKSSMEDTPSESSNDTCSMLSGRESVQGDPRQQRFEKEMMELGVLVREYKMQKSKPEFEDTDSSLLSTPVSLVSTEREALGGHKSGNQPAKVSGKLRKSLAQTREAAREAIKSVRAVYCASGCATQQLREGEKIWKQQLATARRVEREQKARARRAEKRATRLDSLLDWRVKEVSHLKTALAEREVRLDQLERATGTAEEGMREALKVAKKERDHVLYLLRKALKQLKSANQQLQSDRPATCQLPDRFRTTILEDGISDGVSDSGLPTLTPVSGSTSPDDVTPRSDVDRVATMRRAPVVPKPALSEDLDAKMAELQRSLDKQRSILSDKRRWS